MRETRTTSAPEVLIQIDPSATGRKSARIQSSLRDSIRSGLLPPGTRLPSSRALAADLGCSRGAVVAAFEQLVAEGYIEAVRGSGTRVATSALPDEVPAAPGGTGATARPLPFDLRPGPDVRQFPRSAWARALTHAVTRTAAHDFDYLDPFGAPELRTALSNYLRRVRGAASSPHQVMVCSGFAHAVGLLAHALQSAGVGRLAVEDPSAPSLRSFIDETGLEMIAVPVDDEGLQVDGLEHSGARAVLVTPAHQFPTGVVLSPPRRTALIEWARSVDGLVIEDDYDAEYRYDRAAVGTLHGLAPDRVALCGSLSKMMAPGLRLGWAVLPERWMEPVRAVRAGVDLGVPTLDQLALADFVERGDLDRHLRRSRIVYRARRDVFLRALAAAMPDVHVLGVEAGLHVTMHLADAASEGKVVAEAARRGVAVYPLTTHYLDSSRRCPGLVLGYGRLGENALGEAVAELAEAARVVATGAVSSRP